VVYYILHVATARNKQTLASPKNIREPPLYLYFVGANVTGRKNQTTIKLLLDDGCDVNVADSGNRQLPAADRHC
jgi:hypothetical protein